MEKFIRTLIRDVARPVSQRVASTVGGVLSGLGMAAPDVSTVEAAVPILIGLAFDTLFRRFY